ncbi:MAG: PLP-dependent transferase, partial [Alphaproteobacteria bacterium]|nr:PLP-dependent transferase [Alphaproteobacteria bacterium]
ETPIGSVLDRPTRLVWVETPSNPLWQVVDIATVAAAAHAVGARLAVDGTTTTPILTRALEYGADLVFHSATKAIAGHSDVLLGVVATRVEDADWQAIRAERKQAGAIPGGFEVWLALRGLRTLPLRIRHTSATALALATWLAADPRVERVLYPGLTSHPGHAIAASQMQGGYGAMLSILTRGDALAVASRCRLFVRATSLGGPESLIEHRYTVEGVHTRSPASLLRLSIGLEAVEDLIADLDQALA